MQIPNHGEFFQANSWNVWLELNLNKRKNRHNLNWCLTFGTVLDNVWRAGNELVFRNKTTSFRSMICRSENQMKASIHGKLLIQSLNPLEKNRVSLHLCNWNAPRWILSLCVDAAVRENGTLAGCGGVGKWIL